MGSMKLTDIPTQELRRILHATERAVGADSSEAEILRRELTKRQQRARDGRRRRRRGRRGRD